jgi:hypothetical protein|tara:strand:+ start:1982 stop:2623 length:642 start_codon:yes stop_codon:yes gene_type:complete
MEIPDISIPKIDIPTINIPISPPYQVLNVPPPSLKLPGCVKYHRDASPKNTALYDDDPRGTTISCPYGSMPTFQPLLYDRRKITITEGKKEDKKVNNDEQPKYEQKEPKLPKKKEEEFFIKCPGDKDQRVGDFRNDKKLERVVGHKLSDNKKECITLYEDTKFIDQYLPSAKDAATAAGIALVAATTPILVNAVKPLVKQLIKKLTKKKDKVE